MAARKKTSKKLATMAGKYLDMDYDTRFKHICRPFIRRGLFDDVKALAASVLSQYEHEESMKRVQKKKRKEAISADPIKRGQRNKRKQQSRKQRGK